MKTSCEIHQKIMLSCIAIDTKTKTTAPYRLTGTDFKKRQIQSPLPTSVDKMQSQMEELIFGGADNSKV